MHAITCCHLLLLFRLGCIDEATLTPFEPSTQQFFVSLCLLVLLLGICTSSKVILAPANIEQQMQVTIDMMRGKTGNTMQRL